MTSGIYTNPSVVFTLIGGTPTTGQETSHTIARAKKRAKPLHEDTQDRVAAATADLNEAAASIGGALNSLHLDRAISRELLVDIALRDSHGAIQRAQQRLAIAADTLAALDSLPGGWGA